MIFTQEHFCNPYYDFNTSCCCKVHSCNKTFPLKKITYISVHSKYQKNPIQKIDHTQPSTGQLIFVHCL